MVVLHCSVFADWAWYSSDDMSSSSFSKIVLIERGTYLLLSESMGHATADYEGGSAVNVSAPLQCENRHVKG